MTESQFTSKLLRALKQHPALKRAVIWKHSDRFSRGVPDFSVSIGKRTLWFEVKIGKCELTKIQKWFLNALREGGIIIHASPDGSAGWVTYNQWCDSFEMVVKEVVIRCINA